MAIIDVGHTVFLFLIAIPIMQAADGDTPDLRTILKNAVTSPTFIAMLAGIALGTAGVDTALQASPVYGLYGSLIDFLTAPTGMLILITLGYDMALRKELMGPVAFTSPEPPRRDGGSLRPEQPGDLPLHTLQQKHADRPDAGLQPAGILRHPSLREIRGAQGLRLDDDLLLDPADAGLLCVPLSLRADVREKS